MKNKCINIYKKIIEYIISNRLFISYFLISIFGTTLLRISSLHSFGSIYPFLTDLGIILIFGAIGYFVKSRNQFRYFFTCLCIYTLVEIVNSVYYVFYTSFASFGELASLSQAETVTGSIWEKIRLVYFIYLLFPIIFFIVHKKLSKSSYYNLMDHVEKNKKMVLCTLITGILVLSISFIKASKTDYSRLAKQWNRIYIVERFGILVYQGNDLFQTLRPKLSSLFGYEEAENLFNEYFSSETSQKYKEKNKYSNILSGKNIVFVHMESIQDFVMDLEFNGEQVTPNLNKLSKEGMFFSNFYPEVSTGTSSDTEFSLLSSLMPAASGTVFVSYFNRNYVTLPKLLTDKNYYTFSMHGNLPSMWNRSKAHPSLGYQDMYFQESFNYTEDDVINLGINDKLFFSKAIEILEKIENEHDNYMGTVITLSNHSPFTFLDKYGDFPLSTTYTEVNEITKQSKEITTDFLSDTDVGHYLKSVHYADEALGELLEYIKNSESFNDTIFVFYGDHDAKFSRKELNYLYNYDYKTGELYNELDENYVEYDAFDHELNKKTPLIIWTKNSKLKNTFKGEVKYYMGMIDLSPTILNMIGVENKYALGHDIFTIKDNNTIPFPNGNYLTNKLYYNNSTGNYKLLNEKNIIDDLYIDEHKNYVENLLDVSNAIIVYNLLEEKGK